MAETFVEVDVSVPFEDLHRPLQTRALRPGSVGVQRVNWDLRPAGRASPPGGRRGFGGGVPPVPPGKYTATLVKLASQWRQYPALAGLRALVFDDFQASHAYNAFYLNRPSCAASRHAIAA